MRRPSNIVYWVDERPPAAVAWLSGLQHVGIVAVFLLYPLVVARGAGASEATLLDVLSLSMLALAASTLLAAWRGPVGAGILAPAAFNANFIGPSLVAAKLGGLPLVFGMTLFAGLLGAVLARLQYRLRAIFTPELVGLVVVLIGVSIGALGARQLLGGSGGATLDDPHHYGVAGCTLALMMGLTVWGGRTLRLFCAFLGMAAGYVAAASLGLIPDDDLALLGRVPLFGIPGIGHVSYTFDATLIVPFAVVAVASCLRSIGVITASQRISDADWVRPDRVQLTRGLLADASGTFASGLLGTIGASPSPTAVATTGATGVTSRFVAIPVAAILTLFAFMPKVAATFTVMPRAVISAALLFSASFVLVSGLQILSSRLLDTRRTFVIGLSIIAALSVDFLPGRWDQLPTVWRTMLESPLVVGILVAISLTLAFRIGQRQRRRLVVRGGQYDRLALETFIEDSGAAWAARRDVIERAKFNLMQATEAVLEAVNPGQPLEIEAAFDELRVEVRMSYAGPLIALPDQRPTPEEVLEREDGHLLLAGWLLRGSADRVTTLERGGRSTVVFTFDH